MLKNKKILIIGLGSMGKRRIRNLIFNGIERKNITGFDKAKKPRNEASKQYKIKTYSNFKDAYYKSNPDAVIISTPPNKHHQYFLKAARDKKHFFVETSTTDNGYHKLIPLIDNSFVAAPSCTMYYFSPIKKIKELIQKNIIGQIQAFTYHSGQYLPDWHPWEDYRYTYFSKKETGACREMLPYDLVWITDITNSSVTKIGGITEKVSNLKIHSHDTYALFLKMKNGVVGTILTETISRYPKKFIRLIGSEGIIEWDEYPNHLLSIYNTKSKKWKNIKIPTNKKEKNYVDSDDMYHKEIKAFLTAIDKKTNYPYTFKEFWSNLKVLKSLEKSNRTNRTIKINLK